MPTFSMKSGIVSLPGLYETIPASCNLIGLSTEVAVVVSTWASVTLSVKARLPSSPAVTVNIMVAVTLFGSNARVTFMMLG